MTTNVERAADVIEGWVAREYGYPEDNAESAARSLADAGLLMPGLPEPEMENSQKVWRVDEEGFVYIKPNGWIATVGVGTPYDSPDIAHRHGLALIAAARHHAEQENPNA